MMRRQSGVALVLVLWVITLLAVIAGNFAFSMRGEVQVTRNLLLTAQLKALADAGVQRAWYELAKPPTGPLPDPLRWEGNGVWHEMGLGGGMVRVMVLDESGKIDLNTASDELLKGLFKSTGLNDQESASLLDAVLDWRDGDDLRRVKGAEEAEYKAAGRTYAPANAPFDTVDELQNVLGMTPELYRRVAPALTVYSRQPGVNTAIAPREVLLALPGVNPELVEQYLQQRRDAIASGQKPLPFAGAGASQSVAAAFSVRSEARMGDGSIFVREAVGRLSPDPKRPVTILAWGEGDVASPVQPDAVVNN
jgi:general secretion pathway protein K